MPEIPINKPKDINAQSAIFSNYKNKNILKVMVGCYPHRAVSYSSDAFSGSANCRQIIERSDLLKDKDNFQDHDSKNKSHIHLERYCSTFPLSSTPAAVFLSE